MKGRVGEVRNGIRVSSGLSDQTPDCYEFRTKQPISKEIWYLLRKR